MRFRFRRKQRVEEMPTKVMDDLAMWHFINDTCRAEADENLRVYTKGIRVSLINVGYDRDWVESTFRDALEYYYTAKRERDDCNLYDLMEQYNRVPMPEG